MNLDSVKQGTCRYIDAEIMSKATGLSKWVMGAMITTVPGIIDQKYHEAKTMLKTAGITTEEDDINLDKAEDMLINAATKYGNADMNLAGMNISLNSDDIRKLAYYIKQL